MTAQADPRGRFRAVAFPILAIAAAAAFCGLGVWQVQRLAWKTDLIAQVEARLAQPGRAAPSPSDWSGLTAQTDEYRRVTVAGRYLAGKDSFVQAVTEYGAGYWVMTPMQVPEGWIVWVNRGFVPADRRNAVGVKDAGEMRQVNGLLRMSQPGGAFLRRNDTAADRWYSRDVQALARARGIGPVAPYFIDRARQTTTELPVGGLTVISFRNHHLSYALTWFAMAAGLAIVIFMLFRRGRAG